MPGAQKGREARKERAAILSVLASALITVAKGAAGFATGSLALISDAAHSLLDVAATTMTWLAVRAANQPADEKHHYGHAKFESLAALIETAFLFVLSGAVAFEGVRRLSAGEADVTPNWWAVAVLVGAIIVDAWRWHSLTKVSRETGSEALAADALHFSADLVNSVLVLVALGAAAYGFPQADALVAIVVAIFIAIAGFRLARRTLDTLLDTAPKGIADDIRSICGTVPGVVRVDQVRVRPAGGRVIGEVSISVSRTLPLEDVSLIKERVGEAVRARHDEADLTVTTTPVQLDDESALDRIMLIAARKRVPVHHVTVQSIGDRLSVSADLEIDGRASLDEAHAVADAFESAVRDEFGQRTEVDTHIEPLEVAHIDGREAEATIVARIAGIIAEEAKAGNVISDVHSVRVRDSSVGLVVNYHCRADGALDVASLHDAVDQMDRRIRAREPAIVRIVGHAEPHGS